ncbi:MAG: ribosome maturation factor RimP [Proteobacteria bacterium]|nr:ribosome maturation factor RimP [Pseudomonadota bacterium]
MGFSTNQTIEDQISAIALPVVQGFGLELLRVEFRRERDGLVLRLFIDRESGVNVKDCERVSQDLNTMLSLQGVDGDIPGSYRLEVSSPGLERHLTREKEFLRNIGKKIRMIVREPDGRKISVHGVLQAFAGDRITVATERGEKTVSLADLESAQLWFDWKEALKSREKIEGLEKKKRQRKGRNSS